MNAKTRSGAGATPTPLAITAGDPGGIGPELAVRVVARPESRTFPLLVATRRVAEMGCDRAGIPFAEIASRLHEVDGAKEALPEGRPSAAGGRAALRAIERAVALAREREVAAVVTGPASKTSFAAAGLRHRGQTELLRELTGATRSTMLFVAGALRVALLTTHLPLAAVPARVTRGRVLDAIRFLHHDLERDFGLPQPRILVPGLNPHLGENGLLGREEIDHIEPAVQLARREYGIDVEGPLRAEEIFPGLDRQEEIGVLALHHEQALVPLKAAWKLRMVNVTTGLPIVRTSPDHGTAFDLVGTGRASTESFRMAIRWAVRIAKERENNR